MQAITAHGVAAGTLLALKRLLRCHPWGGHGYDPVPPARIEQMRDVHTHRLDAPADSLICIDPVDNKRPHLRIDRRYSIGIHPWNAADATPEAWATLERLARSPRVMAIGEAGLDTLRGPELATQEEAFIRQARLAEQVEKPLIIHAVHTIPQLIALRKRLKPRQRWIIHGFRGKPALAQELLRHGFDLSIGPQHNPDTLAEIPADRLFRETDAPA